MNVNSWTTFSGVPVNFALRSSRCEQTPTGQVLEWHWRTMMQPIAIREAVPTPYSSAPSMAAMTMSRPVLSPPSTRSTTLSRRSFMLSTWCTSDSPISHGRPTCLIEDCGLAPVPPLWPEIRMVSAFALATPAAMVPMPVEATSLTQTRASGLICLRS